MKKCLFIVLSTLISCNSFATQNKKVDSKDLFFCPEKIECSREGRIESCKPIGEHIENWTNIREAGKVQKGNYKFLSINNVSYQKPEPSLISCTYENITDGISRRLEIWEILTGFFEAYYSKEYNWNIYGYDASCSAKESKNCPVLRAAGLAIDAEHSSNTLNVYANGVFLIKTVEYYAKFISVDKALYGCEGLTKCTLQFLTDSGQPRLVGIVEVDMNDAMKIIEITPEGKGIYKEAPFNTVAIQ